MTKKLSLKLALAYSLVFIVAITSIDVLLILAYRRNQFIKTESVYFEVAKILSHMAESNIKITNLINIDNDIYRSSVNGRILYLDNEGRVLADSISEFEGKKITNKEIRNVLNTMESSIGYYTYNGKNMAMFAHPVLMNKEVSGIILISAYIDELYKEISSFTNQVILISVIVFLFVISISILIGERIIKPIKILTSASREILNGNMYTIVDIKRNDEIGVLAKTFNLMSEELHKIDMGRKRFLSDVSHELKTPLASIKVLIESLIEGESDSEMCKEYLSDVNSEIDRLTSLVRSLITVARLEEIHLKLSPVNLYDEIESVIKIFGPTAREKGIKLHNKCDRKLEVTLDREMFREVLINLIDNGIKYGRNEGYLSFETQTPNNDIELLIKDDGLGISEENLPFIFDNFYRVDEARTRDKGGSGIGLFIVKRISTLHGWNISVNSELHKGTQFKITF
ncbi:MAG: sensor histidine kinase [Bacillota bacterium]